MAQIQCSANNAAWQRYKTSVRTEQRSRELLHFYQICRRRKASAKGNLLDRKQTSLLLCSSSQGGDGMKGPGEVWWERGSRRDQVSIELWPFSAFKSGTPQSD